jgi:hypothetical protein
MVMVPGQLKKFKVASAEQISPMILPSLTVIKELFTKPTTIAFTKNHDPLAQLRRILLQTNVFGSSQSLQTRS